jgi:uncharacterized membrane protein
LGKAGPQDGVIHRLVFRCYSLEFIAAAHGPMLLKPTQMQMPRKKPRLSQFLALKIVGLTITLGNTAAPFRPPCLRRARSVSGHVRRVLGRIFGWLVVSAVVMVLLGALWLCCTGRTTNTNRSPTRRCQTDRLSRASEEIWSSWAAGDGDRLTGVARKSCNLIGEDCRMSQASAYRSRELSSGSWKLSPYSESAVLGNGNRGPPIDRFGWRKEIEAAMQPNAISERV